MGDIDVVGTDRCQYQIPFEGVTVDCDIKIPAWFCHFIFYIGVCCCSSNFSVTTRSCRWI